MVDVRRSPILRTLPFLIAVCFVTLPAQAKYSGGTGEPNEPYQIATAADLIALGETPEDYDKHFILTADIDLDPNLPGRKVFDRAVIAPDVNEMQGGFQGTSFTGVFDGNGRAISRLTITGNDHLGLFGRLAVWWDYDHWCGGEVKNLGMVEVNISGSGGAVGGLAGYNDGRIATSYSSGSVRGGSSVGVLVGYNYGSIVACYSRGAVRGRDGVGGLVGGNGGSVAMSYSISVVSGDLRVGGLVGLRSPQSVSTSFPGTVSDSFWDVQTSGQGESDGGTGKSTVEMKTVRTFLRWTTCGNGGTWTIDEGNDYPRLAWESTPGIVLDFRLSDLLSGNGTEEDPYLIYTAHDIETIASFPCEQGKRFHLMFVEGQGTRGSPYLLTTAEQFDMIGMLEGEWDKHYKLAADIDLSAFDGKNGRPALNTISLFSGVFDGDGHAISRLTITCEDSYCGLFGQVASGAEVGDLAVVDVNISGARYVGGLAGRNEGTLIRCTSAGVICGTSPVGGVAGDNGGTMAECFSAAGTHGTGDYVGGLAGRNTGTVLQCRNSGAVSSNGYNGYVGGLVGHNLNGAIAGCYSTGPVSGSQFTGGLVGYNNGGAVTHCYNTGGVNANDFVGGTVGYNDRGSVTECYSTGAVSGTSSVGGLVGSNYRGSITASFWDMQTSGQATSAGGTGKTTVEMQTAKTFLDAGWDFVGETANGSEDIWKIAEGVGYPRLSWEKYSGGAGEPNDSYQIATAADLILLGETPTDYGKHFKLMADIDLDPNLPGRKVFDKAVIAPDTDTIGKWAEFQGKSFSGVFDGNGHTILHLTIRGGGYLGLFGQLDSEWRSAGQVRNLGVVEVRITGTGDYVGGLMGHNYCGTISQCHSSGVVSGNLYVGGLVGANELANISGSYSTASVTGDRFVGGLVGASCGEINQCYSTGPVIGTDEVGGLVGRNCPCHDLTGCSSTSAVRGTGWSVGDLVGASWCPWCMCQEASR